LTLRVLVSGAGSGVGQAIAKALHISDLDVSIIFADIDPFNPGFFRADEAVLIPRVEEPGSLERIISILCEQRIDAVMIGSVFDMMFFADNKAVIERETGAMVVVSPPATIAMATDKWSTTEFLRTHGLAFPRSVLVEDVDAALAEVRDFAFPLIVKPRFGRASQGVHVIEDLDKLSHALRFIDQPVIQEMIATPGQALSDEYTCSFIKLRSGSIIGPFTARRSLRSGHSWVVESKKFDALMPLLSDLADKIPSYGPINVQLMVGPKGPVPFEFNPRFSGTTAMRAHFGFNEPEMILKADRLGEDIGQPDIRAGMAFRYLEEVYVDNVASDTVSAPYPTGTVHTWF